MGTRNRGGIGSSYRPAWLHRLAEFIPWNRFLGSLNVYKYGLRLHWLAELVPWNRFLGSITWRTKTKTIFFGSKRIYWSLNYRRNEDEVKYLFLNCRRNEDEANYLFLNYRRNEDEAKFLFPNYRRNEDEAKYLFLNYRRNEDEAKYSFLNYRRNGDEAKYSFLSYRWFAIARVDVLFNTKCMFTYGREKRTLKTNYAEIF